MVKGKYTQGGRQYEMIFEEFILKNGDIESKGKDVVGEYLMQGKYDNTGNVNMLKQYIGKHSVNYKGIIAFNSKGSEINSFKINGKWYLGNSEDTFYLESQ